MSKHSEWVVNQNTYPVFQAPDRARKVNIQISQETCGAEHLAAGLFWLAPGHQTQADVHPDAEELYYVVSGSGMRVMEAEEFRVASRITVFIPAGATHQSFNDGNVELCYFYAFGPPPSGPPKQEEQGWMQLNPKQSLERSS